VLFDGFETGGVPQLQFLSYRREKQRWPVTPGGFGIGLIQAHLPGLDAGARPAAAGAAGAWYCDGDSRLALVALSASTALLGGTGIGILGSATLVFPSLNALGQLATVRETRIGTRNLPLGGIAQVALAPSARCGRGCYF